jgi:hypothetical protein
VGLWGVSYGGWLAGMTVCHDPRPAAAVMTIPGARLHPWLEEQAVWPSVRKDLSRQRGVCEILNQTALNLATARPAIPRENILLIDAIHDLLTPEESTQELCQAWGQCDLWRLPHGHFSIVCMTTPGLTRRVLRWLEPRLNTPDEPARPTDGEG